MKQPSGKKYTQLFFFVFLIERRNKLLAKTGFYKKKIKRGN